MQSTGWHFRSGFVDSGASSSRGNKARDIQVQSRSRQLMQEQSALHFESGEEEESNALRVPEDLQRGEPVLQTGGRSSAKVSGEHPSREE